MRKVLDLGSYQKSRSHVRKSLDLGSHQKSHSHMRKSLDHSHVRKVLDLGFPVYFGDPTVFDGSL
jgi:hypothetical protein